MVPAPALAAASSGGGNFLVPNATILFELVIFIIVLGLISKFVLPPLQQARDERAGTIKRALEAGDEARDEAAHLDSERRRVLDEARAEARRLLEQAGTTIEEARADARQRGQVEHDRIINEAQPQIESETARARQEAFSRLEPVVIAAVERVVGIEVDPSRHRAVLERAMAGAGADNGADQ